MFYTHDHESTLKVPPAMAEPWITPDHIAALDALRTDHPAHLNMWVAFPLERRGYIEPAPRTRTAAALFQLTPAGRSFLEEVRLGQHPGLRTLERVALFGHGAAVLAEGAATLTGGLGHLECEIATPC